MALGTRTKKVGYVLGVLVINVLAGFAVTLAFLLFLFRDDPILAAVPAVLAAPAIVSQPWSVAFFSFAPSGFILTPLLTTATTALVYGLLNRWGILERPKLVLSRLGRRKILVVLGAFFLLTIAVGFARYFDLPALHRGMPPSVQSLGLNVTDSRYYCLGQFVDSEWLWQARVPESELARLSDTRELRPLDGTQIPNAFRSMPPYWWHPSITERTTILSTPSFPIDGRGPDGWHALATWNPDDQVLSVWIKNNF